VPVAPPPGCPSTGSTGPLLHSCSKPRKMINKVSGGAPDAELAAAPGAQLHFRHYVHGRRSPDRAGRPEPPSFCHATPGNWGKRPHVSEPYSDARPPSSENTRKRHYAVRMHPSVGCETANLGKGC
jgi:hypothetical protein